jgi:hypothetical protein
MLRNFLLLQLLTLSFIASGQDKALSPYIEFIEKQKTNPVDYVFELFDKYDIVILGERDHRDTTQYILFEKIMSDPRFIQKVGHVFTEVGVCNQTDNANRVLKGTYASDDDFTRDLRRLYRNLDFEILWEKYNYWYFLNSIYRINKNLPQNQKITYYPSDVPYDWNECRDTIMRKEFRSKARVYRDIAMGFNIIQGFNQILMNKNETRKKALVILNSPHSYQNYICTNRSGDYVYSLNSAASYVFDYYPKQVANVMINWRKTKDTDYLVADGKWDAAFHFMNNPAVGFNMKDSPFGEDVFDIYDRSVSNTKYKDIYTGFIFYIPIEDWALTSGIPDIVTEDFYDEIIRREQLSAYNGKAWTLKDLIDTFNIKFTHKIENLEELDKNLEKWKVKK